MTIETENPGTLPPLAIEVNGKARPLAPVGLEGLIALEAAAMKTPSPLLELKQAIQTHGLEESSLLDRVRDALDASVGWGAFGSVGFGRYVGSPAGLRRLAALGLRAADPGLTESEADTLAGRANLYAVQDAAPRLFGQPFAPAKEE